MPGAVAPISVQAMTDPVLRLYLEPSLRVSAEAGQHNFIARVCGVVRQAGWQVEIHGNTLEDRVKSQTQDGCTLVHMEEPWGPRGLTFRRVYHYPFWAIERSGKRWEWDVAKASFDPMDSPRKEARSFTRRWRRKLYGALGETGRDGFAYVALQGRISQHRSFQTCSPLEMVEQVLEHDPARRVVAGLHPRESYDTGEMAVLEKLQSTHPRLEVVMGGMDRLLPRCDYVVTMNSGVGFAGLFLDKPLVLFGQIDFHHIAAKVADLGAEEAIRMAPDMTPDTAAYLWWFWQKMSINAGREDAEKKIAQRLAAGGWPGFG